MAASAQRACPGSPADPAHSQSLSDAHSNQLPTSFSASTGEHGREADQKLLWWPVDHVTVQGSRLAVGDSCYVITGHCVVCQVDDECDMVECTRCSRFTHFACACPKLTHPPQVTLFANGNSQNMFKQGEEAIMQCVSKRVRKCSTLGSERGLAWGPEKVQSRGQIGGQHGGQNRSPYMVVKNFIYCINIHATAFAMRAEHRR